MKKDFPKCGIYKGTVWHGRHVPFKHDFKYRVFMLFMDIDQIQNNSNRLKYLSFNKWNICSVHNKDHASGDGSHIRPWIEKAGKEKGIDLTRANIYMMSFPRMWGYLFNPITLYYCFDENAELVAMLYQVKNTFGEQHGYLIKVEKELSTIKQEVDKIFYVSPFIEMACRYKFRLNRPGKKFDFAIHQYTKDDKILTATWDGDYMELNDKNLFSCILRHPLMTFKVITGIHWEALFIWLKGGKYYSRPQKPEKDVT